MTMFLFAASSAAALMNCVSQNTVALGANNTEPADVVIQAANGRCAREWDTALSYVDVGSLGAARSGRTFERMFEQSRALDERRLRDQVFTQAFEDLMRARKR